MKRLLIVSLWLLSCGPPPPPGREEAKRLNACGDLEPQPTQVADDERAVRVEVRNNASSNLALTGVCLSHRGKRVDPLDPSVKLDELHDRPLVFEFHPLKKWSKFKLHFHATATRTATRRSGGSDHKTNLDLEVFQEDLPDNTIRLTVDVTDEHGLITTSVPKPRS